MCGNATTVSVAFTHLWLVILSVYVKEMEPVATCLDRFKTESTAYMGTFLSNVHMMKTAAAWSIQPLVQALLRQQSAIEAFALII